MLHARLPPRPPQYAQVTGFALNYETIGGSQQCYDIVSNATATLADLVRSTSPMGSSEDIPDALQPCSSMDNDLDLSMYESELFGNFQGTVQYNLMGFTPYVSDLCDTMVDAVASGSSALDAFAAATALFYNESAPFEDRCISSSFQDDYVSILANTTFSGPDCDLSCTSDRQWVYQSCNEFGFFQTTADNQGDIDSPFKSFASLTIENAGAQVCEQAFGIDAKKPRSLRGASDSDSYDGPQANDLGLVANTMYGARHVQGIGITMPNGNCDPWHALSVVNSTDAFYESGDSTQVLASGVTPVEIDGTGHCRDMYAPGTFESVGVPDTASVQWAHSVIAENVASYLA